MHCPYTDCSASLAHLPPSLPLSLCYHFSLPCLVSATPLFSICHHHFSVPCFILRRSGRHSRLFLFLSLRNFPQHVAKPLCNIGPRSLPAQRDHRKKPQHTKLMSRRKTLSWPVSSSVDMQSTRLSVPHNYKTATKGKIKISTEMRDYKCRNKSNTADQSQCVFLYRKYLD